MKKILFLILTTSAFSLMAETSEDQKKLEARAIMDGVYGSFLKVIPYVYSDENVIAELKKNKTKKAELLKNLGDLSEFFKSAKHVEYFQRPGFRPSLETMNHHLEDTIAAVNADNYTFAQKRISAVTSLCISCHSQLSAKGAKNAFGDSLIKSERSEFKSDLAFANYLYLVRRFDEAEKYFVKALDEGLLEKGSQEIYPALRKVISIHTKINFNQKKAKQFTERFLKSKNLPILARQTLLSWDSSLNKWQDFDPSKVTDISAFINTYLVPLEEVKEHTGEGVNDISLLIASGVLSKYLNDHPETTMAPEILYWLAIAERRLSQTFYFTISDLYLKDCVQKYSASPFAKKCYNLYESNVEYGYTGSAGTDIPPEEKRELARLRGYLSKKKN